ncbi:hypothetical protein [Escherichia coli]|uniref:hypothetical protein n=1 Tax=Escherichia coli TaxID=562 RepID=UPI003BF922C3
MSDLKEKAEELKEKVASEAQELQEEASTLRGKLEAWIHKINPCNASETSLRWRIASTLFPDCWCCAGLRGFIYGVGATVFVWWLV